MIASAAAGEATKSGRTVRGSGTRQRILAVASRLFARRGFQSTTVRHIARAVGIADAAIYHHFSGKAEILRTLMRGDPVRTGATRRPAGSTQSPLGETDGQIVDAAVELVDRHGQLLRIVFHEALLGDAEANRRYVEWLDYWEEHLSLIFGRGTGRTGSQELLTAARIAVYTVAMAAQDVFILRRDESLSRQQRCAVFAESVRSSLGHTLTRLGRVTASEPRCEAAVDPVIGGLLAAGRPSSPIVSSDHE